MELFAILFGVVQLGLLCIAVLLNRAATANWEQSVERRYGARRQEPARTATVVELPEEQTNADPTIQRAA